MKKAVKIIFLILFTGRIAFSQPGGNFDLKLYESGDKSVMAAKSHPEFGFLLPEMAGNFKLGVISGNESLWMKEIRSVKTNTSKGEITYHIRHDLLGKGNLLITVKALDHSDGLIMEVTPENLPGSIDLFWSYGGVSGKTIAGEPVLDPSFCKYNVFSVEGNAFTVYYGQSMALKVFQGVVPPESEIRLSDARQQLSPLAFFHSGKKTDAPALAARFPVKNGEKYYFCFFRQNAKADYNYFMLPDLFAGTLKIEDYLWVNDENMSNRFPQ